MITISGIKRPEELETVIRQYCPQNEIWNRILEAESEMSAFMDTEGCTENDVIAYKIMDSTDIAGLMQYSCIKSGFLKKEKLIIHLLTLFEDSPDIVGEVHRELIQKHHLSGELIQVVSQGENSQICGQLKKEGFAEHKNGSRPKYGYEAGSLYYVKNIN